MARLENITIGASVTGIAGNAPVSVVAVRWYGDAALEITFKDARGQLASQLLYREDEERLSVGENSYIEDSVQDGVITPNGGKRVISKHIHFVEIKEDGTAVNAGYAPYLDYRSAKEDEQPAIRSFLTGQQWLQANVEDIAAGYAISQVIPAHVAEVRERRTKLIDKTVKAVKERLTAEIQHWDFRAGELKTKESAGKTNAKLNSQMASRRAEELEARMQKRLAELETERLISAMPPVIIGGAIVIPRGLLNRLTGKPDTFTFDAAARREIELAAMKAVMDIETSLGYIPVDVSAAKVGYDIESGRSGRSAGILPANKKSGQDARTPSSLRFIEVKGRAAGADTVTVSKNEILIALNKPDKYILAIVEVDGARTRTVYLKKPFRERPDFAATSVNFNIAELTGVAEVILKREF